jgi:N6-adenosine-specific RNA methylase IME4
MSVDEMVPLCPLTSPNCALLMWTTGPHIPSAIELIQRWGFTFKTVLFTWEKLTPVSHQPVMGLGYYTRSSCEFVLLATTGSVTNLIRSHSVKQHFRAPIREHSRKPEAFWSLVDELFVPGIHRLEMFAREPRPDWDYHGDQMRWS